MSTKPEFMPRGLSAARAQARPERHPGFLAGRPELLGRMQLPQDDDGMPCRELPSGIGREGDATLLLHVGGLTAALINRFCESRGGP